jgi:periplasmic protein CpxP/Spy
MKLPIISSVLSGCVLAASPLIATADTSNLNLPDPLIQTFPALKGIELTPTQRTRIEQLQQEKLPELQAVLTEAQKQQFQASLQQGKGVRASLQSLSLTKGQKNQLQAILNSAKADITTILTPSQRRQVRRNITGF